MSNKQSLRKVVLSMLSDSDFREIDEVLGRCVNAGHDYNRTQIANALYQLCLAGTIRKQIDGNKPIYAKYPTNTSYQNPPGSKRILEYAKANPGKIITSDLFEELSGKTFRSKTSVLIKRGYLKKIGVKPNDSYQITDNIKDYNPRNSGNVDKQKELALPTARRSYDDDDYVQQEFDSQFEITSQNVMSVDIPFGKIQQGMNIMEHQIESLKHAMKEMLENHKRNEELFVKFGLLNRRE